MNKAAEVFGWYGTLAIIGAYFLNTFGYIASNSLTYLLMNVTGAIGAIIIGYKDKAEQSITLNTVWLIIGLISIIRIYI